MSRKPPNRPGISFEVGAKVEAQDYLKKWYPARIEKLEPENGKLLVHFERWSHRYDEWISWDSSRLRPLERPALRKEGLKDDDHHHHHDKTEFRDGEEVLARWTDCRYYPAKIEAVNKEGMYRVQFYDGVVRSVKRIHIKSMPEDAKGQDWVALVKAATATRSRSFSKPRTSNNSSRLRPDVQGDEDEEDEDEDDRETDEDDETHGGRKRREGEHKDPPTIQGVSASAGCGSSGSSVKDEPQSDSDSPPFTTDNKHNTGHTDPAPSCSLTCSQRRRSQRLAPTSDAPSDPPPTTHHHHEQPAAFPQTPGASTEREESSHHNYCTWAPPTTPAQPAMEQNRVTDSPSTNHVVLEEKSPPPPIAAVAVRSSSVRTPKNRHAREPILSSLRAPEPPSSSGEEPRQFQCTLPGCSKSFRKAKLLDYHLKYYHSGSPPSSGQQLQNLLHQHHTTTAATPSPDRVVRTRATSASLPPVSTAHALELLDSKRRRTVSSSSSLSPQAFHLEDVRSTVRSCGKKKRSSTSVSSDNSAELCCPSSSLPPLAPHPCSLALSPPPPPPRELRLEPPHPHPHQHAHPHPHPHPGLLSNPLQPGLIKMEKRLKMDAKHLSLGRKKDRRDRRDRDPFKLKQKKKKKKKKSKQHCYHNYDGLSLSLLEHSSSSVHHRQHGGNNTTAVSLPAPSSSSSSSKHLVCPRAILQVDLSGENLSEGDFPEDSTTESLPYSAEEELELEEEDVPLQEDELSEACQEIVRCVCQMDEENGFMIQCEECMCWQHSACMGLLEDSIPDQYICYICRDPPGQRCSAKYRHDRDWLAKGHMFGLSVLSENYSKQNSQRIVSTHQLLADLFSLRHVLHGLTLKMDILQDCRSPSLQLWARSWVNSDEHQPMGGLPDCLHFLDPRLPPLPPPPHGSSPSPQPHPLPQPPPSSSDPPLLPDTYITSEHSYQKPADPVHSPEGSLHPPQGTAGGGGDSAGGSAMQHHARQQSTVAVPCPNWVEAGHTPGGPVEPSRTSISPVRLSQAEHQARARTRTCVQWQMNLLTHIEDVQNQLASRMDYIEKELDVLESWLDLSGGLEPPDPLARLPQLKLSIKQLLADLSKLQHISALCSV